MALATTKPKAATSRAGRLPGEGFPWAAVALTTAALLFLAVLVALPLAVVFIEAFRKGVEYYLGALRDSDTRSAIWLTLIAASFAVPLNLVFGLAAAWRSPSSTSAARAC